MQKRTFTLSSSFLDICPQGTTPQPMSCFNRDQYKADNEESTHLMVFSSTRPKSLAASCASRPISASTASFSACKAAAAVAALYWWQEQQHQKLMQLRQKILKASFAA
jgi:hypothetical protein